MRAAYLVVGTNIGDKDNAGNALIKVNPLLHFIALPRHVDVDACLVLHRALIGFHTLSLFYVRADQHVNVWHVSVAANQLRILQEVRRRVVEAVLISAEIETRLDSTARASRYERGHMPQPSANAVYSPLDGLHDTAILGKLHDVTDNRLVEGHSWIGISEHWIRFELAPSLLG